jgi:arginase
MPTSLNTSMVHNRFLSNQEDLGVVAVGFSGGQVREIP